LVDILTTKNSTTHNPAILILKGLHLHLRQIFYIQLIARFRI